MVFNPLVIISFKGVCQGWDRAWPNKNVTSSSRDKERQHGAGATPPDAFTALSMPAFWTEGKGPNRTFPCCCAKAVNVPLIQEYGALTFQNDLRYINKP